MPAPRVLFVKLSSLGDVIHHFPAVTDLRRASPRRASWRGRSRRPTRSWCACTRRVARGDSRGPPRRLQRGLLRPARAGAAWAPRGARLRRGALGLRGRHPGTHQERAWSRARPAARPSGFDRASARERARGTLLRHAAARCRASATRWSAIATWWRRSSAITIDGPARLRPARAARHAAMGAHRRLRRAAARREPRRQALARGSLDRARQAPCRGRDHRGVSGRHRGRTRGRARLAAAVPGAHRCARPWASRKRRRSSRTPSSWSGVDTGLTHLASGPRRARPSGSTRATRPELTGLHGEHAA